MSAPGPPAATSSWPEARSPAGTCQTACRQRYRAAVKLTKWTHSCVRLERDGRVLVIDPGVWSETAALEGADAVLLTHEHEDHADLARLRSLGIPVHAPEGSELAGLPVTRLASGETISVAGFSVAAVGGAHAAVINGEPSCVNLGYVIDGSVYHPGDSLHEPEQPIKTLLAPVMAPWLKTSEVIAFIQRVDPQQVIAIHDGMINERAATSLRHWIGTHSGARLNWLSAGDTV